MDVAATQGTVPLQGTTGAGAANAKTEANRTNLGKDDFLKLFITQLQYQDPMSPMDSNQMMQQMAAMTTVEQMSKMSQTVEKLSTSMMGAQAIQGASMIGLNVKADTGGTQLTEGKIEKVSFGDNGIMNLLVNNKTVQIGQIKEINR